MLKKKCVRKTPVIRSGLNPVKKSGTKSTKHWKYLGWCVGTDIVRYDIVYLFFLRAYISAVTVISSIRLYVSYYS